MKTIIFTGNFHNTTATVRVQTDSAGEYLTLGQILSAERKLCGMKDCHCGSFRTSEEPREDFYFDWQLAWSDRLPKSHKIYL